MSEPRTVAESPGLAKDGLPLKRWERPPLTLTCCTHRERPGHATTPGAWVLWLDYDRGTLRCEAHARAEGHGGPPHG